jgi:hypothetical protein
MKLTRQSKAANLECRIVSAKLSCWRRKVFSDSFIEQGDFACWHFKVLIANASQQFISQYSPVSNFRIARDGCHDFRTCGECVWKCKVVESQPGLVLLRWRFPSKRLANSAACSIVSLLLAIALAMRLLSSTEAVVDEDTKDESECDEESAGRMETNFDKKP